MSKTFKRLGVLFAALALSMCMAGTAFAAAGIGSNGTVTADDNTVAIKKQIVFVNAENTTVREPNITYTYTISAATANSATVKDADGIQATVKNGVAGAISNQTAEVLYADTASVQASSNGIADEKTFSFTFVPTAFTAPGIYRYQITESVNSTKASVSVTEAATYNASRYLDVYVQRETAGSDTMKIYGYVLYEDANTTSFNGYTGENQNLGKKSEGYVNTSTATGQQADVDVYTTQNLVVHKTTTGTMADPDHDFPLSVAFTAAAGVTAPKIGVAADGRGAVTSGGTDNAGSYAMLGTIAGTVRNGSTITFTGIPAQSTVAITETNNSPDSYKIKAGTTDGGTDLLAESIVAAGAAANATSSQTFTNSKIDDYFTNTLDAISPTGVVLRYGPFIFMVAAGVALLVVSMRRRQED